MKLNKNESVVGGKEDGGLVLLEQKMSDGSKGYAVALACENGEGSPAFVVIEVSGSFRDADSLMLTLNRRVSHVEVRQD